MAITNSYITKKNGKLRVCVDYRKLNVVRKSDPFPLPFTESILETVVGHEIYSFLDGFGGYNQIQIAPNDQLKPCFITEWGAFAYRVMSFGLMNASATFQRAVMEIFTEYLDKFMKVILDDFISTEAKTNIFNIESYVYKSVEQMDLA